MACEAPWDLGWVTVAETLLMPLYGPLELKRAAVANTGRVLQYIPSVHFSFSSKAPSNVRKSFVQSFRALAHSRGAEDLSGKHGGDLGELRQATISFTTAEWEVLVKAEAYQEVRRPQFLTTGDEERRGTVPEFELTQALEMGVGESQLDGGGL